CGLTGCAEAWVSLMALRRRLGIELTQDKWRDHALNAVGASIEEKAYQLRDYAENDDPLAVSLFKEQAFILGYAIANWVRLFDPGLVVIGGGLSEASFRDRYMAWVIEGFKDGSWPIYLENPFDTQAVSTQFEWARGGDSAAALGMAFVASEVFG
ncbi:MAG: ROK family protein, partial [Gemmatimonadetes bacterium]|nr:ROK family protein [Gemmatimonadota bacterium]